MDLKKFDDIKSFSDEDYKVFINKFIDSPFLLSIYNWVFNSSDIEECKRYFSEEIKNVVDFKTEFITLKGIDKIVKDKTNEITIGGMENIKKDETYLFISNHRDISLDSAFLNYLLVKNNKRDTETAIGDNLLVSEFIEGVAKSIGCFIVKRNLPPRESIQASRILSEYIEHVLLVKKKSSWIAQKGGRTKNGDDRTNPAVIKMICMGKKDTSLEDFLKKLKIIPIAISYEFDPTDYMKVPELIAKDNNQEYFKGKDEDALSAFRGVMGYKGRVHFEFGKPLIEELEGLREYDSENKKIRILADIIDNFIHKNFKLREINHVAYDKLNNTDRFKDKYTEKDIAFFEHRINIRSKELGIEEEIVRDHFLKIYGTPVVNKYNI